MSHIAKNENKYSLWKIIKTGIFFSLYGCVKYLPTPFGDLFRYCVLKLFMKKIKSVRIKDGATFWFPEGISIGRHVSINEWVFIDGYGGVDIGNCVRIAHGVSIVSENHGFASLDKPIYLQKKNADKIVIESDVWIGMGAKILMGVTIGKGAVIGAGTLVNKNVEPYSIVGGIPARKIGSRR